MRNNYSNKSNKCNGRGPHCCKFNICNVRSIRRACTAVLPQLLQDFRVVQPVSYIFFITKNYSSKSISCDQLWQHWEIYLLTFLPSVEVSLQNTHTHAHAPPLVISEQHLTYTQDREPTFFFGLNRVGTQERSPFLSAFIRFLR